MKKARWVLLSTLFVAISFLIALHKLENQSNAFTSIQLVKGYKPMSVLAVVIDDKSMPSPNKEVRVWNNSGYSSGITDTNGVTNISLGEREIGGIDVAGVPAYTNSWAYAMN